MKSAILINDTISERHHGCFTVIKQINKFLLKHSIKITYSHDTNSNLEDFVSVVNKKKITFDIMIINGEGSLHNSNTKTKNIIEIGYWTKKVLKKKVFLINSVFQNNNDELISKIKSFDKIFVRDKFSQNYLNENCVQSNYTPDIVFSLITKPNISFNKKIIFTDSVYRDTTHILLDEAKKIDALYLPLSTRPMFSFSRVYIRFIIRFYILKMPFIFNKYKNKDYEVQRRYVNHDLFLKYISSSSINVCGRYHAIIFSLIFKKPFVAIKSNTHKVESLLDEIGLTNRLINIKDLNKKNLLNFSKFTNNEIKLIENFISLANEKIDNMFFEICKL